MKVNFYLNKFAKLRKNTSLELIFNRVFGLVISFLSVPILIRNCGTESYGIFILISSISLFLTVSDFGIGNGIVNSLTHAIEEKNKTKINSLLSNVIVFSIFNALIVISFSYLLLHASSLNQIFDLDLSTNVGNQFIKIAFLGASIALLGNISQKLLLAKLQNKTYSRIQLLIVIFTNMGLILASRNSNPLAGMLFSSLVLPNVIGIGYLIIQVANDSTIRISRRYLSISIIWQLIRNGRIYFYLQVAAILNYQIDSILIGYFLDPSQVAEYSIVLKVASLPFILVSAVVFPIWAQTASFLANRESSLAYKNLVRKLRKVMFFSFLSMVIFIALGESFIQLWTGNQISPSRQLILANAIWIPISSLMQVYAMFLNGARENKFIFFTTGLFTLSNIFIAVYFLKFQGNISGPMWSNSLSGIIFFVLPTYLLSKRYKTRIGDRAIR